MGPFLVLPFAFISLPQWNKNWWKIAVAFFVLLWFWWFMLEQFLLYPAFPRNKCKL
jgi:hypothetical protein